jgi:hypothetical protein
MRVWKNQDGVHFTTDEDRYSLRASARWIGGDLSVAIWGGERPHIGAVALAQPRPSLKDSGIMSATASVICVVGHKEDDLVKEASELLAAALKTRVVVTAGIHWDNLDEEGIRAVKQNSQAMVKRIAEEMREAAASPGE